MNNLLDTNINDHPAISQATIHHVQKIKTWTTVLVVGCGLLGLIFLLWAISAFITYVSISDMSTPTILGLLALVVLGIGCVVEAILLTSLIVSCEKLINHPTEEHLTLMMLRSKMAIQAVAITFLFIVIMVGLSFMMG